VRVQKGACATEFSWGSRSICTLSVPRWCRPSSPVTAAKDTHTGAAMQRGLSEAIE
jgi:hypothetical protein